MMQQCLPPGNPLARPLDLFDRELPSLWHMHCKNEAGSWDAVGVFNFEDQPQERHGRVVGPGTAGRRRGRRVRVLGRKVSRRRTRSGVTLTLAPRTARILLIHRRPSRPQVIATNMHVLGGYHEIERMAWDEQQLVLSGQYRRAAGLEGKAYLYVPDGYRPLPDAPQAKGFVRLKQVDKNLWAQEVRFQEPSVDWTLPFGL